MNQTDSSVKQCARVEETGGVIEAVVNQSIDFTQIFPHLPPIQPMGDVYLTTALLSDFVSTVPESCFFEHGEHSTRHVGPTDWPGLPDSASLLGLHIPKTATYRT